MNVCEHISVMAFMIMNRFDGFIHSNVLATCSYQSDFVKVNFSQTMPEVFCFNVRHNSIYHS